jgi:SAM-dependent methyltransferase
MSPDLEFTGERFLPGLPGEIAHEHLHRYAFARRFAQGRRVADVACGEGYGAALLAGVSAEVTGIDLDPATIAHASAAYGRPNLRFAAASATALPLSDASVDLVVSFETVEHVDAAAQAAMLREFARVLRPGGLLLISSPNRPEYSEARDYRNPFHVHELDRSELAVLLDAGFPARRWYRQRRYVGSALWSEDAAREHEAIVCNGTEVRPATPPEAMYFVVLAARDAADLPPPQPALSLLTDAGDDEWRRLDGQAREVLRLDALLKRRDQELDAQAARAAHFEELAAHRERVIVERDAQLQAVQADVARAQQSFHAELESARQMAGALAVERERLEGAVAAQERIIAYRQSVRWWLQLPWLRVRNALQRVR